jgi:hypothetical protein
MLLRRFRRRSARVAQHIKKEKGEISDTDDQISRSAYNVSDLENTSNYPRSIFCPITRMPMNDPVILADGHSYEREIIVKWLEKKQVSPVTGSKLVHSYLTPNHTLRCVISEIIKK